MVWTFNPKTFEAIRTRKGLTQREAATLAGIQHTQQWSAWETGKIIPNTTTLLDISKRLEVSPCEFFEQR